MWCLPPRRKASIGNEVPDFDPLEDVDVADSLASLASLPQHGVVLAVFCPVFVFDVDDAFQDESEAGVLVSFLRRLESGHEPGILRPASQSDTHLAREIDLGGTYTCAITENMEVDLQIKVCGTGLLKCSRSDSRCVRRWLARSRLERLQRQHLIPADEIMRGKQMSDKTCPDHDDDPKGLHGGGVSSGEFQRVGWSGVEGTSG
ncbi:uncharacterized protein IWZ02DRAFT_464426 [Phyllosticta citriasiana]|uniref:uncharacterized protein n=1 Tax=Phyllosticta citriasiana TaxID=595635 RepID=UPI0030FD286D